jgi:hypothetical protein
MNLKVIDGLVLSASSWLGGVAAVHLSYGFDPSWGFLWVVTATLSVYMVYSIAKHGEL